MTRHSDDDPDHDRAGESGEPGDSGDRLNSEEVDERFAELVADLRDETPQWPDTIDSEDSPERRAHPSSGTDEPSLLELWDAEPEDDEDDDEEDEDANAYRPPPPPPLPVPSMPAILGVALIIGGLFLIVNPGWLEVGQGLGRFTGIAAFGGGVLMLIWRLRPEPDDDDDDDDNGAVV